MSALLLLALSAIAYVLLNIARDKIGNWRLSEIAGKTAHTAGICFCTVLAAYVGIQIIASTFDPDDATPTLFAMESAIHRLQAWRESLLGSWDWRLTAGLVGLALAALLLSLDSIASRTLKWLQRTKQAGTVLAILSSLTLSTLPLEEMLQHYQLRYARDTKAMSQNALAIQTMIEEHVRSVALSATLDAIRSCDTTSPGQCNASSHLDAIPPRAWLQEDPGLARIWEGLFSSHAQAPATDTSPPDDETTTAWLRTTRFYKSLQTMTSVQLQDRRSSLQYTVDEDRRRRHAIERTAVDQILDLAIDAGYDRALDVALDAGASGDVVQALLFPLMSAPMKAVIEQLTQAWTRAALHGDDVGETADRDITRQVTATLAANVKVATISRARDAAIQAIGNAQLASGTTLTDLVARKKDEERQQAGSNYTAPSVGFKGIENPGWTPFGNGSPATSGNFGARPPEGETTGNRPVFVP